MNEQFEDLLAVYVLGGLTPEEEAEVEAYAAQNPEAAAMLQQALDAVVLLPYAAPPIEPSAAAEKALFARLEEEAPVQQAPIKADTVTRPRQADSSAGLWQTLLALFNRPFVTAVGLAAAVLVLIWAVSLNRQLRDLDQSLAQLSADNSGLRDDLNTLLLENDTLNGRILELEAANQALSNEMNSLAQFNADLLATNNSLQNRVETAETNQAELEARNETLEGELSAALATAPFTSPDIFSVTLPGTEIQPEASAELVIDPVANTALLIVTGMPDLPENSVYQVLLIRGTEHETAETFRVDTAGEGVLLVHSTEPLQSFDAFGVSIEPEGGSVQRTGDIVLLGSLIN